MNIKFFSVQLLLICVIANHTNAQDGEVTNKATLVKERTTKMINDLKEAEKNQTVHLKRVKQGVIDKTERTMVIPATKTKPIRFPNKNIKDKNIENAEQQLIKLQDKIKHYNNGEKFYYGVLNYPPKIGDFGQVEYGNTRVHVYQVINENSMLIKTAYPDKARYADNKPRSITLFLMVKGISTKGATDRTGFDLPQVFEITDTETYETIDGSNTVFIITPMNTKEIEEFLRQDE